MPHWGGGCQEVSVMEVSVSYTFPRGGERVLDAFREGGERVLERRRRGRRLCRRAALDLSHHPPRPPHGRGPQGDVIRITNYIRLVRYGLPHQDQETR